LRFHTAKHFDTYLKLGKRTDLKLGEVSSFFISYNITISGLYPLGGFRFIFFFRRSENDLDIKCFVIYLDFPLNSHTPKPNKQLMQGRQRLYSRSSVLLNE